MRKFLLALAGCTAFSGAALAADLPIIETPVVFEQPPVIYNWTGIYIGLQGGYGWGDGTFNVSDTDEPTDFQPFTVSTEPSGFIGGGHAGALYQFNNIVVGIEGDIEYNGMDGSGSAIFELDGDPFQLDVDVDYNMSASVRGRVGLAFDRFLLYATGGYAYASIDHTFTARYEGDVEVRTISEGFNGWTAGGGFDAFVMPNVTAGIEYRYTSLEDKRFRFDDDDSAAIDTDHDFHAVRARASFHF